MSEFDKIEVTDKTMYQNHLGCQKIGCIVIVPRKPGCSYRPHCPSEGGELRYLAIECQKGRGIIMPGGKWEPGEKYTETAARELEEETGLIADPKDLEYVWMGPDGDGYMVMAFILPYSCIALQEPKETPEGKPVWAEEKDFLNSKYAAFYECLFQVLG